MRRRASGLALLPLLLSPLSTGGIQATDNSAEPNKFFREFVGLNDDQIAVIRKGKAIAKILESRTPDEVFVFGSVYIESIPEKYLKFASDIDALRRLPSYLAIRKFNDPPQLSDLDGFTLEEKDVEELKDCKPGHYEIQLPAELMEEFQKEVNWSAPDAAYQANRAAQRMALEALIRYQEACVSARTGSLLAGLPVLRREKHRVRVLLGEGQFRTEAHPSGWSQAIVYRGTHAADPAYAVAIFRSIG